MGTINDERYHELEQIKNSVDNMNVVKQDTNTTNGGHPYRYTYKTSYYPDSAQSMRENVRYIQPIGEVLGKVYMLVGGIWTAIFGLIMYLVSLISGGVEIKIFGWFVAIGIAAMIFGYIRLKRYGRFKKYMDTIGKLTSIKVDELAKATGKSLDYTIRDLQSMIKQGVFPFGNLSDEKDYFMLTKDAYKEYIEKKEQKKEETSKIVDEKSRQIIQTGRMYLRQIEEVNEVIEEQEFNEKLVRLQIVVDKILNCVEQNPDKILEIKQLMDYYLPTTLKLVNTYRDFYLQSIDGENATNAKQEIKKAIDMINDGFENLLNDLFKQDSLDIKTDVYVLENMLTKEGLAKNEFEKMQSGGF